jgi:putative transcriptional regulator
VIENRISELLGKRRKSIRDLSIEADIAYSSAHALFHNHTKMVSFDTVEKLCRYFGVDVGEVFYLAAEGEQ